MPKRIRVVGPGGKTGTIPEVSLASALKAGYHTESTEESQHREYAAQPGQAALEGAARSASLGLSDVALTETGLESPEDLRGRKEANPWAEAGGEVAGLFAPGPGKGVSKVGQRVEAAVGGKLQGALARGAAEGGLFGLGQMISENSIGDPQANAEKLASVGGSALFGAGVNAVTHGVGVAGSALINKLGGATLNSALRDLAEKSLWGQIGAKNVSRSRNLAGRESELSRYALDNGLVPGMGGADNFGDLVEAHRKDIGAQMGDVLTKASSRTVQGLNGPVTQTVHGGFDSLSLGRRVKTELLDKLAKDPAAESAVNYIEKYLGNLDKNRYTLAEANSLLEPLRQKTKGDSMLADHVDDFRRIFRDEIRDQASQVSPHFGQQLADLGSKYEKTSSLGALAREQALRESNNSPVGLGGMLGAATAYSRGGVVAGIGGAAAAKFAKERGGYMLAAAADKLAGSQTLQRIAAGLKSTIDSLADQNMLGSYRAVLENAGAEGSMALLAKHVQLAKSDPKYLPTLGLENEDGDASNQYASKADRLHSLESTLKQHDAEVDQANARFLGQVSGRTPEYKLIRASKADFSERMARINQVLSNPTVVDTSSLAATAPTMAMASATQTNAAAQFLMDKAPKNPGVKGLPALAMPWEPSQSALEKWYRYVRVVEHPLEVMKELNATGTITPEAAETMRTVYPKILEDMKAKMMDRLMAYDKPLSYAQKRGLDAVFGSDYRGVNPKKLALLQSMQAASMGAQQPSGGGAKKDGRQTQTQEQNMTTQAQRTEGR